VLMKSMTLFTISIVGHRRERGLRGKATTEGTDDTEDAQSY